MAYQSLDLGTSADDGTGDSLRVGGDKINDNFSEIYTLLGTGTALTSGLSATATVVTLSSAVGTFTTLTPAAADGTALGSASLEWSDLFLADGAVINLGADQDVTLTHMADTGLLLNGSRQFQFGDSGTYIHQSADGVLDLVSDTEIEINATTIDINGAVDISGATTTAAITASGIIKTDDATDATSTTDGSLQTDGGLSVAKNVIAGNDIKLQSDASVIAFGVNDDVTLTHVHNTGLLINSSRQLQFNDASQNINAPSATVLDINATDEIELNATLVDVNANLDVSGTYTGAGLMTLTTASGENKLTVRADAASQQSSLSLQVQADTPGQTVIYFGKVGATTNGQLGYNPTNDKMTFFTNNSEKMSLTTDGLLTITDDLVIKTGGTIGGANDTDLLTLTSGVLTVAGEVVGTGFTGTLDGILGSGTAAAATTTTLASTTITASGIIKTDDTTEATSTTDGSLQTDGGLSVVKDAVFGDDVKLLSDSSVIALGADGDVTITHVADTGIALNTKNITGATSISGGALGGRRNAIYNPTFSVNQRHGTGANTTMNTYAMDRWRCFGGGSGQAHSWTTRSDAGEGDGYYSRFQRPVSNTATAQMGIAQGLETIDSRYFAGKEVTLSFRARGGANWSPTSGNVAFKLVGGEGTDQNPVGMTTTEAIITITAAIPQGGGFVQYSGTGTVPADKTQLAIQISWNTVGTAGANDYWDMREVQLELGGTVTQFEQRTYGEEFQLCQRYFEKSDDPVFHINCGAAASQVQRLSIRYATQKWEDATLVVSSSTSGLSGAVTNGVDGFTLGFTGSDLDIHHITFTAESEL
jgi:hypothetical protein